MTSNLFLRKKEILLFSSHDEHPATCQLKNFIHCLNHFDKKRPLRFAYSESNTLMMSHLTIKENILLDGVIHTLCSTKEFQLKKHLDKEGRPRLVKLFNQIGDIELRPDQVSTETLKLVSLLKTLLRPSDYLFFENPQMHLSDMNLAIFIEALKEQVEIKNQTIFIHSTNEDLWSDLVSKKILKEVDGLIKVLLPSSFKKVSDKIAA